MQKHLPLVSLLFATTGIMVFATTPHAASHQVAWTFGNAGSASYVLDAFEPSESNLGTIGSEDPTLALQFGQRYQVTIVNAQTHPFEVIAKGDNASGDTVLLSMSGTGILESDPGVAWIEDGLGTVSFTVTLDLYAAMVGKGRVPGYRCGVHVSTMRGDFNIQGIPDLLGDVNGDKMINLSDVVLSLQATVDKASTDIDAGYISSERDLKDDEKIGGEEALYALQVNAGLRSVFESFTVEGATAEFPDDGNRLVILTVEDGGSVTFFGTQSEEDELTLTGLTAHSDDENLDIQMDNEGRPTEMRSAGGFEITLTYNEDDTLNYTIEMNEEEIHSETNVTVDEGGLGSIILSGEAQIQEEDGDDDEWTQKECTDALLEGIPQGVCQKLVGDAGSSALLYGELVKDAHAEDLAELTCYIYFFFIDLIVEALTDLKEEWGDKCDKLSGDKKEKCEKEYRRLEGLSYKSWDLVLNLFLMATTGALDHKAFKIMEAADNEYWQLCGVDKPDFPLTYKGSGSFIDYEERLEDPRYVPPKKVLCETATEWEINLREDGTVSGRFRVLEKVGSTWLEGQEEGPYIQLICEISDVWRDLEGAYSPDGTLWVVGGGYFYIFFDDDLSFKARWNLGYVEGQWWEGFEEATFYGPRYLEHQFELKIPKTPLGVTSTPREGATAR
jgi:hypothetical protein